MSLILYIHNIDIHIYICIYIYPLDSILSTRFAMYPGKIRWKESIYSHEAVCRQGFAVSLREFRPREKKI